MEVIRNNHFSMVIGLMVMMKLFLFMVLSVFADPEPETLNISKGLLGYWKLHGDCKDHSGNGHDGINHGVDLDKGFFDGKGSYIEVPTKQTLQVGKGEFTISAWVHTDKIVDDTLGDIISFYDPRQRRGINFGLHSSAGGYQSKGDDRHIFFGIDNARLSEWQDCGRPNPTSNYVSNSLTVYNGDLYAGTIDAGDEAGWCHVYRYAGGKEWIDCGRVGNGRTTGVMALIVHQGKLYAGTSTYDWTRVFSGKYDNCHVYRYDGGKNWVDCGQPGNMLRINCMATFGGKLYAGGDRGLPPTGEKQWTGRPYQIFVYEGGTRWSVAGTFPPEPPHSLYPHAMAVHDGRLYAGYPNVFAYDGQKWEFAGTPLGNTPVELKPHLQVHSLSVFQGNLIAGMWPEARVVQYEKGTKWSDRGHLGDGTEINALCVYNGKLYAGAIPRGEVSRLDDPAGWTSLRKFFSPKGWEPGPPTAPVRSEINNWTRVTSLTIFQGRLFASIGSCTSSVLDAPAGIRGSVHSFMAGQSITHDKDLGPGWNHITAVRKAGELRLYVNGKLSSRSAPFDTDDYDLTVRVPLKIGFGEHDYFSGRIRAVRLYSLALADREIGILQGIDRP